VSSGLTGRLESTSGRIADRLEEVTGVVQRSLDRFNGDMERVLGSREEALTQLIGALGKKAQDVDSMMRGYMSLIEESLGGIQARSAEAGRLIGQQTSEVAASLQKELSKLEGVSAQQVAGATEALRDQHERAMAALTQMMAGTTKEFQDTVQEMRLAAQQVAKDIEAARNELKKSITELPQETRANADAMRRVIADQITALSALADLVKKQSGNLDLSGPGVHLQQPREAARPVETTSSSPTTAVRSFGSAEPRSTDRSMFRPAPLAPGLRSAPQPQPQAAAAAPRLAPKTNGDYRATGQAISEPKAVDRDLSRETEALMQKLNGAARDLVEAIDGTLPGDLERRFEAGESHVYTHRLFEDRGPMMRRAIRKRYQDEKVLRGRVDAYVRLFERLLDTVSETSQGEQLADACLASESGKLYVMLANASGRINAE